MVATPGIRRQPQRAYGIGEGLAADIGLNRRGSDYRTAVLR